MTLYSYKVTFTTGEIIMLRAALKNMIQNCDNELDKGETAPFYAHKKNAQNVLDRLNDGRHQLSGNHFEFPFDPQEEE